MQHCHPCPSGSIATMLAGVILSAMLGPTIASSSKLMVRRSQPVPKAGDPLGHVKTQLAADHRTLGNVSAALMSVQSSVDKTEESMLGKVLDLQTARTFFARHEEIDSSNVWLKSENAKLNSQVDRLSSSISKEQREYLSKVPKDNKSEWLLQLQIAENEGLIGSMNTELLKAGDVKADLKRLTKINSDLMAESAKAAELGRSTQTLLGTARSSSLAEVRKHRGLRNQLVLMNNYSTRCYTDVEKKSKKLGIAMLSEAKDNEAAALTLKQKTKANDAAEQRLLAEHALLVSQVIRIETEGTQGVQKVADLRSDQKTLEENIVKEVHALEAKIKDEQERVKSLSVDLMENTNSEMDHNEKKEAMEAHIQKLEGEIHDSENPVIIATTEGQNEALEAELKGAFVLWKEAKRAETAAELNFEQVSAQIVAEQASVKLADEALATAREEAQKQVAEAVKKAAASKAKSQVLIDKAQAVVAARCKPEWDEIWKKKRAKLVKCRFQEEEYTMEIAKKETLMQTLKAQASD